MHKSLYFKAMVMNMSTSCASAVEEHLPDTPIVFDRYHVMALINRQIDALRRQQQHCIDAEGTKTFKGSRFLHLRNYHELSDTKKGRPDTLLATNQPLFSMHAMKESFRLFWNQGAAAQPSRFFSTGASMS